MTGVMIITAYHRSRGEDRPKVLTPDSAHGTNPATCAVCGRHVMTVASRPDGRVDLDDLRAKVDDKTAALMITNPNTTGLFDPQIEQIAEILHAKGALLYLDGANMNAILGIARPGDFGVDVMHYNTHKTFSTPHGCGGPGSGPVAVSERLREFLPGPQVIRRDDGTFGWQAPGPNSIGRVRSYYGQVGVLIRAYAYIRALGPQGLREVSEKAVLSANYLAARLRGTFELPFDPPYAHEFILVPNFREHGVTELDIAKRLIDHSIHPPTMSWPVAHCLMIEPTECESLATLDQFVETMLKIADEATNRPGLLHHAPLTMPVHRLDEVTAARKPDLRWRSPGLEGQSHKTTSPTHSEQISIQ
jgi:glycine dehydrogenase subunit 2